MHHPTIRVTVSISTAEFGSSAVRVIEDRTVPIVELEGVPTVDQWNMLARVLPEYAERAVLEAQGQARELADSAPQEAVPAVP